MAVSDQVIATRTAGEAQDRSAAIVLVAALIALAGTMFTPAVLNDPDTYWHLAAGKWMLDHRMVLHTDVFSFSKAGMPWETHEWLSEVAMALAFAAASWNGVLVLTASAAAATVLILGRRIARSLGGLSLGVALVLSMACIGASLLARPHMLVLPLVALWTVALLDAREKDRAPNLAWAFLLTAWANLHGSYVLGFMIAAAFGLEALIGAPKRWPVIRDWGLFGAACLGASLITPHGLLAILYPFKIMTMSSLPGITEWRPTDFSKVGPLELALMAVLFIGFSRGVRVAPVRLFLLIVLLHMALQHARHVMVLAVVAPMLLAEPFARALGQPERARRPWISGGTAAFAGLALALAVGRLAIPFQRTDGPESPIAALASVPAELRVRPVLNNYDFGGYLIFSGVKPFIDGRADMYGDAFTSEYFRMTAGDPVILDKTLAGYDIAWTILPVDDRRIRLLDGKPGWRRSYADKVAVVHVRTDAPT
jgi:hypothetical protein